jgi:serine phosphatase RsbU (regulator of sigma subunit)
VPGDGRFGGDWYDVFPLPSGELGVVVGDVAGSGLNAAVVMGRMRSSLRAYALESADPGEVLYKLDRKMQYFEGDVMATVCYGMLDPREGQLRITCAGHFPPVVAVPGRPAGLAAIAVGPPIGVSDPSARQVTALPLKSGTVLCLFTDGLVERRGQSLDDRLDMLCAAVAPVPPESVCTAVMGKLVGSDHSRDDTALLVLRWLDDEPGDQAS